MPLLYLNPIELLLIITAFFTYGFPNFAMGMMNAKNKHTIAAADEQHNVLAKLLGVKLANEFLLVEKFHKNVLTSAETALKCKKFVKENAEKDEERKKKRDEKNEQRRKQWQMEEEFGLDEHSEGEGVVFDEEIDEEEYEEEGALKERKEEAEGSSSSNSGKNGKKKKLAKSKADWGTDRVKKTLCTAIVALDEHCVGLFHTVNTMLKAKSTASTANEHQYDKANNSIRAILNTIMNFTQKSFFYTIYRLNNEDNVDGIKAKMFAIAYKHLNAELVDPNMAAAAENNEHWDHWDDDMEEEEEPHVQETHHATGVVITEIHSPRQGGKAAPAAKTTQHQPVVSNQKTAYHNLMAHLKNHVLVELEKELDNEYSNAGKTDIVCECLITLNMIRMQPEYDQKELGAALSMFAIQMMAFSAELTPLQSEIVEAENWLNAHPFFK